VPRNAFRCITDASQNAIRAPAQDITICSILFPDPRSLRYLETEANFFCVPAASKSTDRMAIARTSSISSYSLSRGLHRQLYHIASAHHITHRKKVHGSMVPEIGVLVTASQNGRDEKEGYFGAIVHAAEDPSKVSPGRSLVICAWAGSFPCSPPPLRAEFDDDALRQVLSTESQPKSQCWPGYPHPLPHPRTPTSQSVLSSTFNLPAESGSEISH